MKVTIVGLGLIGGSFLKASELSGHEVVGLHHGDKLPVGDNRSAAPNLILVCLPPPAIVPWISEHARQFARGTIVVDICGVKREILHAIREAKLEGEGDRWIFVGGHPMAGREVSGFGNSKADLFVGASMILTPLPDTDAAVLKLLREFFASVGFHETVVTTGERHDDMIAFTSQLCHVIATTYSRDRRVARAVGFSAGSYANMTRIATQDAEVWSSLYAENRDALVGVLDDFAARLREFRDAIADGDAAKVKRIIDEGTRAKRQELLTRQRGDERP